MQTPSLDQHCGTNHQNLFDNIRVIATSAQPDLFKHGGAGYWKPTHGKFNTFWNIDIRFKLTKQPMDTMQIKGVNDGPSAIFVGLFGNYPIHLAYGPHAYIEGLNHPGISVPSLYSYQLNKRLAEQAKK